MTPRSTVVPAIEPLTEEQFLATWLQTLGRLCRAHGDAQIAKWLGVSLRHLRNVKAGTSLPTADKIWNLLAYDASAHDEMDAEFGYRTVPKGAACTTDEKVGPVLVAALHKVVEAEAQGAIDHHELLNMEPELRSARRSLDALLERIAELRRPRAA